MPDPPGVLTSNAGWNLTSGADWLGDVLARLAKAGIRTSLFLEPDAEQIRRARKLGADRIELFTGPYAKAFGTPAGREILAAHREAARLARKIGLGVNAATISISRIFRPMRKRSKACRKSPSATR